MTRPALLAKMRTNRTSAIVSVGKHIESSASAPRNRRRITSPWLLLAPRISPEGRGETAFDMAQEPLPIIAASIVYDAWYGASLGPEIARSLPCQRAPAEIIEQTILEGLRQTLDDMIPLVRQVIRQTPDRPGSLAATSTPRASSTGVIRKGKAGKPIGFGKLVKLQEAENQIVVGYEVYTQRSNEVDLLMPAIERSTSATPRRCQISVLPGLYPPNAWGASALCYPRPSRLLKSKF
jgi:hypothetical protein